MLYIVLKQGRIDPTGTETWQFFSHMLGTLKKQLFTPSQNKLVASVSCVSSTLVALNNYRLLDWLLLMKTKYAAEKRSSTKKVTLFPKWNTNIKFLSQSHYARDSKSIIIFKDLCKLIKIYIYFSKKTHIYKSFRSKAPKTQQTCSYRHTRNTSELF